MSAPTVHQLMASIKSLAAHVDSMDALLRDARAHAYSAEVTVRLLGDGKMPRSPVEFRSQFGEDIAIWNMFGGRTEGFFIEVEIGRASCRERVYVLV